MKAIVSGDSEYVARSFDDLRPGAHVAVRASPTQLPDSGLALRLAGFEIRDTIAHIVGDRIVWWILARKPLDGTVAQNVLEHGVGGLNIDASRVESEPRRIENYASKGREGMMSHGFAGGAGHSGRERTARIEHAGRFPANVLLDEHAAKEMDEQSGWQKDGTAVNRNKYNEAYKPHSVYGEYRNGERPDITYGGGGGASRFFPLLDEDGAENWIRRLIDPDQSP